MPDGRLIYCRGEIWWVELDPTKGLETKKTRACLILQNDLASKQSSLTVIAPFLAKKIILLLSMYILPSKTDWIENEVCISIKLGL